MGFTRTDRGAWRRGPLPGALTRVRMATLAPDHPSMAEAPEPRRAPDGRGGARAVEADDILVAPAVRHGGCLCGAVRFVARGEPAVVGLCHCADCRKATGGVALHYADWPAEAVTLTGTLATFAGRSFCPRCGGRVAHVSEGRVEINLGALDDPPNDLRPRREGWTIRREPWMPPVPGAEQFERDPA